MSIDQFIAGSGLVIGAREFWGALPVSGDVQFVDEIDLLQVRKSSPQLRDACLAPVDLVDKSGALSGVDTESVDYIIDWSVRLGQKDTRQQFAAAARVLTPGGALLIAAHEARYTSTAPGERQWTEGFVSFVAAIASTAEQCGASLELTHLSRRGTLNVAVFKKTSVLPSPAIVSSDGRVYLLDGGYLRHVTSLGALDRLRAAGMPNFDILEAERLLFAKGVPLHEGEAVSLIAKMDVDK